MNNSSTSLVGSTVQTEQQADLLALEITRIWDCETEFQVEAKRKASKGPVEVSAPKLNFALAAAA
jgi:hypothetical protein